ncbi:hypothetical protein C8Q76DRAFT_798600 [Earliella scabrosa]|nr:hypothetical protein C8Q76DRAFT_798600 [Earliella scabrosa]
MLPRYHVLDSHIKVDPSWGHNRILVAYRDSDPSAMEEFFKFIATMPFPEGTEAGIAAAGLVRAYAGGYIFFRDTRGSGLEEDDSLQLWVTIQARDKALGPRHLRSSSKPSKTDGVYSGGTAYERSDSAANVVNAPRCYTLAQSYQVQKNVVGPTASAKIGMGEAPNAHLLLRQEIVKAAALVAISSLETAPAEISMALRRQAEVINLPHIGYEGNYAFPTMQANFAATQSPDALALSRMQQDFGSFGGKHVDEHDSVGGITSMITYSDLADDDHPGYFIVGDLGVAVLLLSFIIINFCGRHFHGSYPPTAAPGKKPKKWSCHVSFICYPASAMINGSTSLNFTVLLGNKVLAMPPEFVDPRFDDAHVTTNVANWVHSGTYLTTPPSFLRFYYRAFSQLAYHLGRQVPGDARMEIDYQKLSECFRLVEKDGTEHRPEFWELHPGSSAQSREFGCTRQETIGLWCKHHSDRGKFVAHHVHLELQKKAAIEKAQSGLGKRKRDDSDQVFHEYAAGPSAKKSKSGVHKSSKGPKNATKKKGNARNKTSVVVRGAHVDAMDAHDNEDYSADIEDECDVLDEMSRWLNLQSPGPSSERSGEGRRQSLRLQGLRPASSAAVEPGRYQLCPRNPFGFDSDSELELTSALKRATPSELRHQLDKLSSSRIIEPTALSTFLETFQSQHLSSDMPSALAFHRRRLMLCSAAAWYWLNESCNWLERLTARVYGDVANRVAQDYSAADFLPHLQGADVTGHLARPRVLEENFAPRVHTEVLRLLRLWLNFPSHTNMLSAYFVMYVVGAFKNSDVLLLDGVWRTYRTICASILGNWRKPSAAPLSVLDSFGHAVATSPLADPSSVESQLMSQLSTAIETCSPGVRRWTDAFAHRIVQGNTRPSEGQSTAMQTNIYSLSAPSSATNTDSMPSRELSPGSSSNRHPDSHPTPVHVLERYAKHLLPVAAALVRGTALPNPSELQSLVMQQPDHFLPFRELAPSRRRVTAPGGPFHLELIDVPGAFTSCIIFHTLLFDSPILQEGTHGYFQDCNAWNDFLATNDFNPDNPQSSRFFNISCYGTPQAQRRQGHIIAPEYFDFEQSWHDLQNKHPAQLIPFEKFVLWIQGKRLALDKQRQKHRFSHFPHPKLVGKLIAYLLAADLVYAAKVAAPSLEDVAKIIHSNKLGSYHGLITAGLIPEQNASLDQVTTAFRNVFDHLHHSICPVDREFIRFDGIMVEHLLYTYARPHWRVTHTRNIARWAMSGMND